MVDIKELEEKIKIKFNNKNGLVHALTHKSYAIENNKKEWNERLEFLGDSILSSVIADYLYHEYPDQPEGVLSRIKSQLVSRMFLAKMAKRFSLGKYVLLSIGEEANGGRKRESILANTYESLLGAIYLDRGYQISKQFVINNLSKKDFASLDIDYKSKLQEFIQTKFKILPDYSVVNETGPEHQKIFKIIVTIKKKVYGTGTGKSKKEAEQMAAKQALEKIKKQTGDIL